MIGLIFIVLPVTLKREEIVIENGILRIGYRAFGHGPETTYEISRISKFFISDSNISGMLRLPRGRFSFFYDSKKVDFACVSNTQDFMLVAMALQSNLPPEKFPAGDERKTIDKGRKDLFIIILICIAGMVISYFLSDFVYMSFHFSKKLAMVSWTAVLLYLYIMAGLVQIRTLKNYAALKKEVITGNARTMLLMLVFSLLLKTELLNKYAVKIWKSIDLLLSFILAASMVFLVVVIPMALLTTTVIDKVVVPAGKDE